MKKEQQQFLDTFLQETMFSKYLHELKVLQKFLALVYLDFFFCDETALKTIVRSNPAVLKINNGTINEKFHWNDFSDLKF